MSKEIILILIGIVCMLIQESEVNMKQYYDKNNDKWTVKRFDSKSDIKRKYKLIIEEEYIYESDSPEDIDRIIDSYVNYT